MITVMEDCLSDMIIQLHRSYVDDKNIAVVIEVVEDEDYSATVDKLQPHFTP